MFAKHKHTHDAKPIEQTPPEPDIIIPPEQRKVNLSHFTLLRVLGRGTFGKVMLVQKKDTNQIFAMKVLHKSAIISRNQVQHTKTERHVLQIIDFPFIVKLHYAFQSAGKLYLIMDYLSGGELFFHLKREGRFSESRTKFYVAEIAVALQHLHSLDIVYRDLKPENILLDEHGHICITDFGLSKEMVRNSEDAKTLCGTPEYVAPEILQGHGHGKAVDWWSLGTLMYEMLDGLPPFFSNNTKQMYDNILNSPLSFENRPHISSLAQSLLYGLIDRDPKTRYGWEQVCTHPFFAGVDWNLLVHKRYRPEFIPQIDGVGDTSNFDQNFTREPPNDSPASLPPNLIDQSQFQGFTFDPSNQFLANNDPMMD
eukprot:c12819_g1_i1.p1 GENE.c12819_g1_i1~~c12819_g1_i1.p1  ORF type:complete len:368 (+),score=79.93 c12819_g1_i1:71-1174(+)